MGKKKDSDAVSEHRDSSDMNEGKYNRAPPKPHDPYTVADSGGDSEADSGAPDLDFDDGGENSGGDSGAADLDFDDDMAFFYVDERASEGLARICERVEEDGREGGEGEDERKEPQEANDTVAVKRARNTIAARKSRAKRQKRTESVLHPFDRTFISSSHQPAGLCTSNTNCISETSVADRLLAAWTTVKPVI